MVQFLAKDTIAPASIRPNPNEWLTKTYNTTFLLKLSALHTGLMRCGFLNSTVIEDSKTNSLKKFSRKTG